MNKITLKDTSLLFFSYFGFIICYFLISIGLNPILSSSLVGLIFSLSKRVSHNASTIAYCSSFAALGISDVHHSLSLILLTPTLVWITFTLLRHSFHGYGGKLGTIAFISVLLLFSLVSFL